MARSVAGQFVDGGVPEPRREHARRTREQRLLEQRAAPVDDSGGQSARPAPHAGARASRMRVEFVERFCCSARSAAACAPSGVVASGAGLSAAGLPNWSRRALAASRRGSSVLKASALVRLGQRTRLRRAASSSSCIAEVARARAPSRSGRAMARTPSSACAGAGGGSGALRQRPSAESEQKSAQQGQMRRSIFDRAGLSEANQPAGSESSVAPAGSRGRSAALRRRIRFSCGRCRVGKSG